MGADGPHVNLRLMLRRSPPHFPAGQASDPRSRLTRAKVEAAEEGERKKTDTGRECLCCVA